MNTDTPVLEGAPVTDEQKRLVALFDEVEIKQLEFLDEAGKRIIELTTALLGVVFVVFAFGDKFPPPYLVGNTIIQILAAGTVALYLGAMLCAMRAVQPGDYKHYRHNISRMREELDRIIANKSRPLQLAGILFWLGSVALALLISQIVFAV